jgi:hypothetical protein
MEKCDLCPVRFCCYSEEPLTKELAVEAVFYFNESHKVDIKGIPQPFWRQSR